MSEYWKSNPRKFCDFCKCWIADNKPSVEFHERGKRHKESVQKRLDEIGKKGKEDYENKLKEKDYMREMEEAALKAYKKDIENNPDYTGSKIAEIVETSNARIVISTKLKEPKEKKITPTIKKKWQEAKTAEGVSYYWNTETGESVWEVPKEGFASLEEQGSGQKTSEKSKTTKLTKLKSCKDEMSAKSVPMYGPMARNDPYGNWESAHQTREVNLDLPTLPEQEYYVPELVIRKPEVSFKEKVVSISKGESTGLVSFKKRKGCEEQKKNVRRRTDD